MVPLLFLNVTVKPVLEMLDSSKKSPVAMFNGVMPMVGNAERVENDDDIHDDDKDTDEER